MLQTGQNGGTTTTIAFTLSEFQEIAALLLELVERARARARTGRGLGGHHPGTSSSPRLTTAGLNRADPAGGLCRLSS